MAPDRPLHIGFASPGLSTSEIPNGILTYVKVMRAALLGLGHRVTIVSGHRAERPDGSVWQIPRDRTLYVRLRERLDRLRPDPGDGHGAWQIVPVARAVHRRDPFDVYESEEGFGWFDRLPGLLPGAAVVARLHGPHFVGRDPLETPAARVTSDHRCAAEGRAIRRARAISCPSARLLAATLAEYAARPAVSQAIPNPVVVPAMPAWTIDAADPHQILCVGRFDLRKGADIVVRAFAEASARLPALRLVMAGPDPGLRQADGGLIHFDDFVAREIPPEVRTRIRFLGPVTAAEVRALRLASGVAVVGSRFENFAYSVAESMALGAPTIVSDSFGNGEMIEDGVSGLVVPVGDVAALAAAMLALAQDRPRAAAMGAAAFARCRDWLSPEAVAAETLAFYGRARASIGRRGGRG